MLSPNQGLACQGWAQLHWKGPMAKCSKEGGYAFRGFGQAEAKKPWTGSDEANHLMGGCIPIAMKPLDARHCASAIGESLVSLIAVIRVMELGPRRPCCCYVAIRIARLAFVGATFAPRRAAKSSARADGEEIHWPVLENFSGKATEG